jgi:exonuclease SbcC
VLSRQKEINVLSESTPGERKKAIRRMLGIESIQSAIEAARAEHRDKAQWLCGVEEALEKLPELRLQEETLQPTLREARQHAHTLQQGMQAAAAESLAAERKLAALEPLRAKDVALSQALTGTEADLRACGKALQELRRQVTTSEEAARKQQALEPDERDYQGVLQRKTQLDKASGLHSLRAEQEQECQRLEGTVAALDVKLRQAQARVEKTQAVAEEHRSAAKTLDALKRESRESQKTLQAARKRLAHAETRAEDARKRAQEVEALGTEAGACPTCFQKLGTGYRAVVKKLEVEARTAEAEQKRQATQEKSAQKAASAAEAAVTQAERRLEALDAKLQRHREQTQALQSLERERASEQALLERQRKRLARIAAVPYDARAHQAVEQQMLRLRKQHDAYERLGQEAGHLSRRQKELKAEQGRQEKLRRREVQLQKERRALGFEPDLYTAAQEQLTQAVTRERHARDAHARAQVPLATHEEQARELRKRITELEANASRIRGEQEESLYLGQLVEVLKAFQAELITRVGPQIEEYASRLLDQMTRGRYPRLSLDADYKISMEDGGQAHALQRFSGGEEDLANLCLRIAISQLVSQRAGGDTSSLLVLDEVFGSQDIERRERILEALSRLQGMFQQILLITHMEDIQERVPNMLRVGEDDAHDASVAAF